MSSLSVTEKEHWKNRIARKIDLKIEAIIAADPGLLNRVTDQARQQALRSLGLAEMQAELDAVAAQREELDRRERQAERAMLAVLRRLPVESVNDLLYASGYPEVEAAIEKRRAVHEEELLAQDERGREVLRLRREKDNLLDTVWLATSPAQVRTLWQKVSELLGEEQTPLQREALAIGGNGTAE